jgi:SNF2 family DNA or RNA helicase
MLRIDYDQRTHQAILEAEADISELVWAEIRSVCDRRSPQTNSLGPRTLALPWWGFLLARPALSYVLRKHAVALQLSETSRSLLREARNRELAYHAGLQERAADLASLRLELQTMGFARELTREQLRNLSFLMRLHAGATFSVPGAGKTTEALAYFCLRRREDTRLIVVCPKNAFSVWEEQLGICLPKIAGSFRRLEGGEITIEGSLAENPVVSVISYQQLYRVVPVIAKFMVEQSCFLYLDESHRMKKGYTGAYGGAILSLCHLPFCKLILSGTPVPNSYSDLVPQFTFLYPGLQVSDQDVVSRIRAVYVRTTKSELGLRNPIRVLVPIHMGRAQNLLYDNLRSEAARQMQQMPAVDRIRLRSFGKHVVRLLETVTEPALLIDSEIGQNELLRAAIAEGTGPKIGEACRRARTLAAKGEKCIIWSQFVRVVESIAELLSDLGAEYIHGGVETDEDEANLESREAKIRRFREDPNCFVLVANPAACAESISLHDVCHHAIYVDRSYNAAHYLQSEDRIHRLGLSENQDTYIYLLHCVGSVDDSVKRRLEWKVGRMATVLNDASLSIEPIEAEDESGFDEGDYDDIKRVILPEE